MRNKQARLADQFWKLKQHRRHYSLSCYGKGAGRFVETNILHSLTSEPRLRNFSNGYNNVVCCMSSFIPRDEQTKLIYNVNSIQEQTKHQGKAKTIDFTGIIWDLHKSSKSNLSKNNSVKNNLVPTISSVFQPIYHMTSSN